MQCILALCVCALSVSNSLHVNRGHPSAPPKWEQISCPDGDQIPVFLQCDGISDCRDGSDESAATCSSVKLQEFNEQNYRMIQPKGYVLPDAKRYKRYWDVYVPKMVELPYAGKSTSSVEIYYLQAPAFHDNDLGPFGSWALQQFTRLNDIFHAGAGMLFRDEKGRELGRVSIQYWSAITETPDNPNLLPYNNTIMYDDAGRLLFAGRAVTTYARSRGNWEGGYWTEALHLKTMDVKSFNKKLPWIDKWLVDHQQFSWVGVQDTEGNVLMPKVDCDRFAREMMKEFTNVDVMYLPYEAVRYLIPFVEVNVIERNADPRRVKTLLDSKKFKRVATNGDVGGANYAGLMVSSFWDQPLKVDPEILLLSPVAYNPDLSLIDGKEFVSHVDIVHPTGRVINREVSTGLQMKHKRTFFLDPPVLKVTIRVIQGVILVSMLWCVFSCLSCCMPKFRE